MINVNVWLCFDCCADEPRTLDGSDLTANYDSETEDGMTAFSKSPCAYCKDPLAGERFRFAVHVEGGR